MQIFLKCDLLRERDPTESHGSLRYAVATRHIDIATLYVYSDFMYDACQTSAPRLPRTKCVCVGESTRAREREREREREDLRTIAVGYLVVQAYLVTLVRSVWKSKRETETER